MTIDYTLPADGVAAVKSDLRTNLQDAEERLVALETTFVYPVKTYGVTPGGSAAANSTALIASPVRSQSVLVSVSVAKAR